jgi:ADP-ribosylglycohydrolase
MNLKDKFLGAILGCAVGDALGAPLESAKGSVIKREDNLIQGYRKISRYPLGQWTDDTQLTLALSETYISNHGFKGADFAKRIADLWTKGEVIGPGLSCTEAARNLQKGKKWQDSGSAEGKAGNGTAMRASPVGLWNYDNLEQLKKRFHRAKQHHTQRPKGKGRRGRSCLCDRLQSHARSN